MPDRVEEALKDLKTADIPQLAQKLRSVIDIAIDEAGKSYVRNKVKTVETEYDEELKKPIREVVTETENIVPVVDTMSLKRITSALKDVCDLSGEDENGDEGGVVILGGSDE